MNLLPQPWPAPPRVAAPAGRRGTPPPRRRRRTARAALAGRSACRGVRHHLEQNPVMPSAATAVRRLVKRSSPRRMSGTSEHQADEQRTGRLRPTGRRVAASPVAVRHCNSRARTDGRRAVAGTTGARRPLPEPAARCARGSAVRAGRASSPSIAEPAPSASTIETEVPGSMPRRRTRRTAARSRRPGRGRCARDSPGQVQRLCREGHRYRQGASQRRTTACGVPPTSPCPVPSCRRDQRRRGRRPIWRGLVHA